MAVAVVLCAEPQLASEPATNDVPRIVVEPDILASRDGEFPHVELMIAASPRNPRNLVGGAITYTRPDGGVACKVYATLDGGSSWTDVSFPEQHRFGGADPQVAFTPVGTALFAALATVTDDEGRTRAALHAYRSTDGGLHWEGPADLGYSYDHPQIAVDHTMGRFAGQTYIGVLYGRDYSLGVFRSSDDGRSYIGPVKFVDGAGMGVNVTPLMVLSDGTLVVTWADFPIDPERRKTVRESVFWLATSSDGGVTFSPPVRVHAQNRPPDLESPESRLITFPAFAADPSERHRDRLYVAWAESSTPIHGPIRVEVKTFGSGRGTDWRDNRPVVLSSSNDRQGTALSSTTPRRSAAAACSGPGRRRLPSRGASG